MLGCFVVAPFNDIKSIIVNGQDVFPLIHFGDQFQIEFSPPEPEGTELGQGFIPFLRYTGEDGNRLSEIPEFNTIRNTIGETLTTIT